MKDPLGVSHSKGNQGTTGGKKILFDLQSSTKVLSTPGSDNWNMR